MQRHILDIEAAFAQERAAAAGEKVGKMGGGVGDGTGGGATILGDGLMQPAAEFGIARNGLMGRQQIADELVFGHGQPLVIIGNDALERGGEGLPFGGGIGTAGPWQAGGNLKPAGKHDAADPNAGHHRGAVKHRDRFRLHHGWQPGRHRRADAIGQRVIAMRQGIANENSEGGEGFAFVGSADGEFAGVVMAGIEADKGEHTFDIGDGAGPAVGEGDAGEVAARDGFEQAGGAGMQAVGQRESELEREGHQGLLNLATAGPQAGNRFMG